MYLYESQEWITTAYKSNDNFYYKYDFIQNNYFLNRFVMFRVYGNLTPSGSDGTFRIRTSHIGTSYEEPLSQSYILTHGSTIIPVDTTTYVDMQTYPFLCGHVAYPCIMYGPGTSKGAKMSVDATIEIYISDKLVPNNILE